MISQWNQYKLNTTSLSAKLTQISIVHRHSTTSVGFAFVHKHWKINVATKTCLTYEMNVLTLTHSCLQAPKGHSYFGGISSTEASVGKYLHKKCKSKFNLHLSVKNFVNLQEWVNTYFSKHVPLCLA